jgi:hypothetical protein
MEQVSNVIKNVTIIDTVTVNVIVIMIIYLVITNFLIRGQVYLLH